MSIFLAFMLKELSHHASRDICHNQLEFSDYHLVYYLYADNLTIILGLCDNRNSPITIILRIITIITIVPCMHEIP